MSITLYPDQQALVNRARQAIGNGCKSLLIQATTGAGKSIMATSMIQSANAKGNSCAFLVPRRELLEQMGRTFRSFDLDYSYLAASEYYDANSMNHVCSMQTLVRRMDKIKPRILFVDETHYGEGQLNKIIQYFKDLGVLVVGLSATPWKMNGKGLGCWYDEMVQGESVRWLIDNNRLSDYRLFGVSNPDLSTIKIVNGEFSASQLREKMENDRVLIGDAVSHYQSHANGLRNIAFCTSIKHSKMTAQAFNDAGIPSAHMDAETPKSERRRIINDFADRKLHVLTNVDLMCFGFDLASQVGRDVTVECMSDLRPTKSLALQMQKWGRVLRYKDRPALIFDHANNSLNFDGTSNHGFPCADRHWSLADRPKRTRKKKDDEEEEKMKRCPECFHLHDPAPGCPLCGYKYKPKEIKSLDTIDVNLEEIEIQRERRSRRIEEGMCSTIEDWHALAEERGHSKAWANIRHKTKKKKSDKSKESEINKQMGLI